MPNLSNHLAKLLTREGNESQICPSKGTWTLIPRQLYWFLSPFLIFFWPRAFTMAFQKTCSPVHNWRILNRKTCSSKKWNTNQRLLSAMDAGFLTCNLPRASVCTALFGTRQCVAMLPKKYMSNPVIFGLFRGEHSEQFGFRGTRLYASHITFFEKLMCSDLISCVEYTWCVVLARGFSLLTFNRVFLTHLSQFWEDTFHGWKEFHAQQNGNTKGFSIHSNVPTFARIARIWMVSWGLDHQFLRWNFPGNILSIWAVRQLWL